MRTVLSLTISMALVVAAFQALAMTVKGDQAAWAEVMAANQKLNTLTGYRMTMTMPNGMQSTVEMIPQDTMRMITPMPGGRGSIQMVKIGNRFATKMEIKGLPGTWQCSPSPVSSALPQDPASLQGTIEVSRGPDTQIKGTLVHTYVYTTTTSIDQRNLTSKTTLSVNAKTGLPFRTVVVVGGKSAMTTNYSDYGATFEIKLPAACQ